MMSQCLALVGVSYFIKVTMPLPAHSFHPHHQTAALLQSLIHSLGFLWNLKENTEIIMESKKREKQFCYINTSTYR